MLTSRRFTKRLTESTQKRLEAVINDNKPIARRERDRGAVVAIQSALSDLNQGYLESSEVDGYFGKVTAAATEAYQRDYGLYVDGIVGRQTLMELDSVFSADVFRDSQGMSIHVGVNKVDQAHYGPGVTELAACVQDANDFETVASGLGYDTVALHDEQATTANFISAMRQAALNLFDGDSLLVTFSGHGAQTPNTSADSEIDGMDETLCFHDRMMLDDEVFCLLAELKPGVNVTMLYDSCHSATVTRGVFGTGETASNKAVEKEFRKSATRAMRRRVTSFDPDAPDAEPDAADERRFVPFKAGQLEKALDGDRAEQVEGGVGEDQVDEIADVLISVGRSVATAATRVLDSVDASDIYQRNRQTYEAVKSLVGERDGDHLDCHVVAFSACQDNQTTLDGAVNGLYSGNVLRSWDGGGFNGSVVQLHRRLRSESPTDITPAFHTYGGPRAAARKYERPFAF